MERDADKEQELLEKLFEKQVTEVYNEAAANVTRKFEDYMEAFERKDKAKLALVKAGELSEEDYIKWRKGQMLIGERWNELKDVLSDDLVNADKIAAKMIGDYMCDAYALGHNYGTFLVEKGSLLDTSYTLYSRETVEKLIKKQPRLLNVTKWELKKENKDKRWNQQHITQQITQGILQGEDTRQVAKRLQKVVGMDKQAAMRNARTAMTGAQNSGRMDAYERAEELGIELEKEWLATMDKHTRDSHVELDGEHVPMDEPFSNGLMYPGDPKGDPSEVYNCRCTMIPRRIKANYETEKRFQREDYLENESWARWKKEHG